MQIQKVNSSQNFGIMHGPLGDPLVAAQHYLSHPHGSIVSENSAAKKTVVKKAKRTLTEIAMKIRKELEEIGKGK